MAFLIILFYVILEFAFLISNDSFLNTITTFGKIRIIINSIFILVSFIILILSFIYCCCSLFRLKTKALIFVQQCLLFVFSLFLVFLIFCHVDTFIYSCFGKINITIFPIPIRLFLFLSLLLIALFLTRTYLVYVFNLFCERYKITIAILSPIFILSCIFLYQNLTEYNNYFRAADNSRSNGGKLPNIIFFSSDGLDAERMSAYGSARDTTPNIKEFSKSASIFLRSYGNAQGCSHSGITSILTGKSPITTKVAYDEGILEGKNSVEHLPAILKNSGYYCASFGETRVVNPYIANMLNGFDEFNGSRNYFFCNEFLNKIAKIYPTEMYFVRTLLMDRIYKELYYILGLKNTLSTILSDKEMIDLAVKTIKNVNKPKLIYIHLLSTHRLNSNKPEKRIFSNKKECSGQDDNDCYDDSLLYIDSLFKQITDALIETGQYNQTIMIVLTDHSRVMAFKKNDFLMSRLPLIIKFPGVTKNVCDYPVQYLDIAPSILKAIGINIPKWMEGTPVLYPFHGIKDEWIMSRPIVAVSYNINDVYMVKDNYCLKFTPFLKPFLINLFHLENFKWVPANAHDKNKYYNYLTSFFEYLINKNVIFGIKKKKFYIATYFRKYGRYATKQNIISSIIGMAFPPEIMQGGFRLSFNQGRGELFYRNRTITKDNGMHILLLSSNKWFSSKEDAIWNILDIDSNTLILKCFWLSLPLSHIFKFQMIGPNTINCRIDTEIYKDIKLSQESFILMLSDMFTEYFISSENKIREFPKEYKNNFQWIDVWKGDLCDTSQIGLIDNTNQDKITFKCMHIVSENEYLIISNTNERHKSRALIYNKKNGKIIPKGKYTFFTGRIEIL